MFSYNWWSVFSSLRSFTTLSSIFLSFSLCVFYQQGVICVWHILKIVSTTNKSCSSSFRRFTSLKRLNKGENTHPWLNTLSISASVIKMVLSAYFMLRFCQPLINTYLTSLLPTIASLCRLNRSTEKRYCYLIPFSILVHAVWLFRNKCFGLRRNKWFLLDKLLSAINIILLLVFTSTFIFITWSIVHHYYYFFLLVSTFRWSIVTDYY